VTARLTNELSQPQRTAIRELIAAAASADEVAPLSEHGLLHVRHGSQPAADVIGEIDGTVAGYAYLDLPQEDEPAGELVVHPGFRRRGLGSELVTALIEAAGRRPLRVWAHGDLPPAAALAASMGFKRVRVLHQLRRDLSGPIPVPELPDGVTIRTFRTGEDEAAWLRLNALAFAHHPEQGAWTPRDLELREAEPWFDPAGLFIAERDGQMIGFHWTKVHPGGTGEVYVLGVDPQAHGGGLGRALTAVGLRYLKDQQLNDVMLYVDDENKAALAMYEHLGFGTWHTDVMYRR
jgi:mycothiol synthase